MPIYTGTGDEGQTGLFGNQRVPKDHARIEAYGTIDELNSVIGMLRADLGDLPSRGDAAPTDAQLGTVQSTLFDVGADLATPGGNACEPRVKSAIADLEQWIDASEAQLPQLTSFVLPGGHRAAATLHLARTVTRRAERCYWTLRRLEADTSPIPAIIGVYLNRLSDLCFSWARLVNQQTGVADVPWTRD